MCQTLCIKCKLLKLSIRFLFLCPFCSCHLRMQRNTLITCVRLDVSMKLRFGWQLWSTMKTLFQKRESPIIRSEMTGFTFFDEFVHLYIWSVNTLLFTSLGLVTTLILIFLKVVSYAHHGCIYFINNKVKTDIFWNIATIQCHMILQKSF